MLPLRTMSMVTVLSMCGALAGCQQPRSVDLGPQLDSSGARRSLALDSPLQTELQSLRGQDVGYAWYDDRNDRRVGALAGYESPVVQSSVTYTRDYQSNSHGRSHDHYQRTTYSAEYRQSVR